MSRTTDVIVAGSGLAGLMAAYAAAKNGARVKVISEGMGCLAISAGCIDLLGYDAEGQRIDDPFAAMQKLEAGHPYSLLGAETVSKALDELIAVCGEHGLKLHAPAKDGKSHNTHLPTIAGTLKPTWLVPVEVETDMLANASRILIVSVRGFRDCRPALIASQLSRYPELADKFFDTLVLPAPFEEHGRSLNALDLAHFADRPKGRDWLAEQLKGRGANYDLALLPPMLGARANSGIRVIAREALGCPWMEMLSVPPGVAGMRIRDALITALVNMNVEFYENANIISAKVENGSCVEVTVESTGRDTKQKARAFVVATGGILGGGLLLEQGSAREAVFGIDIPVPANVDDWSEPDVFGRHLFSTLGVNVDASLKLADNSLANVFFAGRILGGYDQAAEKSGHGVAAASGWQAGVNAAQLALGANGGNI